MDPRVLLTMTLALTIVGAPPAAGRVRWQHLSTANGDLPLPGASPQQTACIIADLDGAGRPGIVLGFRHTAPALVWYRPTDAGYERYVIEPELLTLEAGGTWADIDGDGWPDLVVGGDYQSNSVWWWRNPGPGWAPDARWERYTLKASGAPMHHDQVFADFLGRGRPQLAYWNQRAQTIFLAPIPDDPTALTEWPAEAIYTGPGGAPAGAYAEGMSAADIDGDGRPELLAGNLLIRWQPAAGWSATPIGELGGLIYAGRLITGSRYPQIVIAPGDNVGPVRWYACADDDDPFRPGAWQPHDLVGRDLIHPHSLQLGDIDGDGHLDIFVAEMAKWSENQPDPNHPTAEALIFYGHGDGTFEPTVFQRGLGFHEARLADLDASGRLSIINKPYNWSTPRLDIWLNLGPDGE